MVGSHPPLLQEPQINLSSLKFNHCLITSGLLQAHAYEQSTCRQGLGVDGTERQPGLDLKVSADISEFHFRKQGNMGDTNQYERPPTWVAGGEDHSLCPLNSSPTVPPGRQELSHVLMTHLHMCPHGKGAGVTDPIPSQQPDLYGSHEPAVSRPKPARD